jgi:hypothetical protein|tara:strand:+ start:2072 stop:2206 length:135 start_codon:yes stop_codon:yes gene_type:complete
MKKTIKISTTSNDNMALFIATLQEVAREMNIHVTVVKEVIDEQR